LKQFFVEGLLLDCGLTTAHYNSTLHLRDIENQSSVSNSIAAVTCLSSCSRSRTWSRSSYIVDCYLYHVYICIGPL